MTRYNPPSSLTASFEARKENEVFSRAIKYTDKTVEKKVIDKAEKDLGLTFDVEYRSYLESPIEPADSSTYEYIGLEWPVGNTNVVMVTKELRKSSKSGAPKFPENGVVLAEVGNGDYYYYDTKTGKIGIYAHDGKVEPVTEVYGKSLDLMAKFLFGE